ncbi:hypothetical protein F5Y17DRAFT_462898 [Xylariaceae sp. FL0594]|nr:hypothetical protein F5Y17DRAFT_462898 [Xylariaceae sp. FL0594]
MFASSVIDKALRVGFIDVCIDYYGAVLSQEVRPGPRSAESRSHRFSFLEEITDEEMKSYTAAQLLTILQQRDKLREVLEEQTRNTDQLCYLPSRTYDARPLGPPPGIELPVRRNPWVPSAIDECHDKYCHNCRPSCEQRSYLSLNAIANGDLPPTAVTGYGFPMLGSRPVIDANVVKHLGLRKDVPRWEKPVDTKATPPLGSEEWSWADVEGHERPSHSPPPTPGKWTGVIDLMNGTSTFEKQPWVCGGRSPASLKTNTKLRDEIVKSIPGLMGIDEDDEESEEFQAVCPPSPVLQHVQPVALGKSVAATPMMMEELQEGTFHDDPLTVAGGVAVLEESVQLGVPDVITQV